MVLVQTVGGTAIIRALGSQLLPRNHSEAELTYSAS